MTRRNTIELSPEFVAALERRIKLGIREGTGAGETVATRPNGAAPSRAQARREPANQARSERTETDGRGPRQLAQGKISEHQIQAAVIDWWAISHKTFKVPVFALAAWPNGGAREAITGARLKAEGVRRGMPDLALLVPRSGFHGCFLELKARTGKLSADQTAVIAHLRGSGYNVVVCWSIEEATRSITAYLGATNAATIWK